MKTMQILKEVERYAVFNANTVRSIIKKDAEYTRLLMHRLEKAGHIFRVERNKYTVHKNAFLIASRIVWPSYISFWSALRYYNLTEQIPHAVWVISPKKKRRRSINFFGSEIFFVSAKPKYFFGFRKVNYSGFEIFVAEPEKAFVDSLLFRKISFPEMQSMIKNSIRNISAKKFAGMAIKTGNAALIKRAGFLLDSLGYDFHRRMEKYIYPSFTPLDYGLPARGKKNYKWKVIENVRL
ncbi:hypothetical protein D4Q76_01665 [archaeon]|nr:MAG: hypothetical protein D4Q76_01665 [archaeon]